MKNKVIKIIASLISICIIFNVTSLSLAVNQIDIINRKGTPIEMNEGILTKEITRTTQDEITIELNLKIADNKVMDSNTQIMFLVDNSSSMAASVGTDNGKSVSRRQKIITSTEKMIKKIHENNPNVKMGILEFSRSTTLNCDFTNNIETLTNACNKLKTKSYGSVTNMASAIKNAKNRLSSSNGNKILILLTDGFPSDGAELTKSYLKDDGYYIITGLIGINSSSQSNIEKIFGTEDNPVADKFYNISDQDIEAKISQDIYTKVIDDFQGVIKNTIIRDYFPKEIIDNFEINILNPDKGEAKMESIENLIWNISELRSGENAILEYTIKLKADYNEDVLNEILKTNEKVVISYKNMWEEDKSYTMSDSPQIRKQKPTMKKIIAVEEEKEKDKNEENIITTPEAIIEEIKPQENKDENVVNNEEQKIDDENIEQQNKTLLQNNRINVIPEIKEENKSQEVDNTVTSSQAENENQEGENTETSENKPQENNEASQEENNNNQESTEKENTEKEENKNETERIEEIKENEQVVIEKKEEKEDNMLRIMEVQPQPEESETQITQKEETTEKINEGNIESTPISNDNKDNEKKEEINQQQSQEEKSNENNEVKKEETEVPKNLDVKTEEVADTAKKKSIAQKTKTASKRTIPYTGARENRILILLTITIMGIGVISYKKMK